MADGIDIALLDQSVGQKMQRPALAPGRGSAAHRGNQEGFGLTIEHAGFARGLLAVMKGRVHSCFEEAALDVSDGDIADLELFTDGRIPQAAVGAMGIAEQQDLRAFAFPLGVLIGAGDNFDLLALFLRERDNILSGWHEAVPSIENRKGYPILIPESYLERLLGQSVLYLRHQTD